MKFHFEPNQQHQLDAISAVAGVGGIFQGAPRVRQEERLLHGDVSSNVIKLPRESWFNNARRIARENGIDHPASIDEPDFSIEMETGTGKTYVYLRTIFELNRRYGLHKFIIVVPSVAIREGTLTQLHDTKQHFAEMYGGVAEVIQYNSNNLPAVHSFCLSNHLSIMVMNKQAFDSDNNVINDDQRDDGNLLEMLRNVRPIIILDEPQQGMDTENMQGRLAAFNPLFKLRYSATHRHPKNIVYRLTPYEAYNAGLVKKISVLSIHETDTQSNVSIRCDGINLSSSKPTAKLQLNCRLAGGEYKSKKLTIKHRDNLEEKTNNPAYHGWVVENIGSTDIFNGHGYIKFSNGKTISEGQTHGSDKEAIFREQIRRAIQSHFDQKERVENLGIKPLTLFFIDRVANYVTEDGLIRRLFEEEYTAYHKEKFNCEPDNISDIHAGYFAKTSKGVWTDDKTSMAKNKEIYERILRKKKEMISFDDKLEFIFSHTALGVGWDNPNVFTICTLNDSHSTIKKRQEIGRGLRLCVDQSGKRYRDPENVTEGKEVNLLTVVANDSYHNFVSTYQLEICEELGINTKAPKPRNGRKKPKIVRRNDRQFKSDDFKKLWALIAKKTKCRVYFNENHLIDKCIAMMNSITVGENRLVIGLNHINRFDDENEIDDQNIGVTTTSVQGILTQIDTVSELSSNTAISERTSVKILSGMSDAAKRQLATNPMQFLSEASKHIRNIMNDEMVRVVEYNPTGETYPIDLIKPEIPTNRDLIETPNRGLYDHAICDSNVEMNFAASLDSENIVRVFVKLPPEYKIPMPFGGTYNPDFALMIQKNNLDDPSAKSEFYFTVETKGASEFENLKEEEKLKIRCAIRHFEAIGLKGYLAPVENLETFDAKARDRVNETFFNQ